MENSAYPDHLKLSDLGLHCFSKEDIHVPGFSRTVLLMN